MVQKVPINIVEARWVNIDDNCQQFNHYDVFELWKKYNC